MRRRAEDAIAAAKARPDRLKLHRLELELKALKGREQELLARLNEAEARNDLVEWVRSRPRLKPIVRREKTSGLREATAFLMGSDWHVGEEVRAEVVGGVNEFTPSIAKRRVNRLAEGFRWHMEMHRTKYLIREVVFAALGDFVTGWLHQDQVATNTMLPMPEVFFAKEQLRHLILDVLEDSATERVTIVCTCGNHGRTTVKPLHSARKETNLEWLIFGMLQQEFSNEKRVQFEIAGGDFVWLDVYGHTIRASHGDGVMGGGGIGGLMAPIQRAIHRWNRLRPARLDLMGHHHQCITLDNVVVNGSLIGTGGYSVQYGHEEPSQNFFLFEPLGARAHNRIWVDRVH